MSALGDPDFEYGAMFEESEHAGGTSVTREMSADASIVDNAMECLKKLEPTRKVSGAVV